MNCTNDNCPPSQDALLQHIRRAMLQSNILSYAEVRHTTLQEPTTCRIGGGWQITMVSCAQFEPYCKKPQNHIKILAEILVV